MKWSIDPYYNFWTLARVYIYIFKLFTLCYNVNASTRLLKILNASGQPSNHFFTRLRPVNNSHLAYPNRQPAGKFPCYLFCLCSNSQMTSWKLLTLVKSQFWLLSACPLHLILSTVSRFSTDFSILSVFLAMSSHGFAPIWLTAHPLLKLTRPPHPTQQYPQVYHRVLSLAHFFLFSLYHLSPVS